MGADLGPPSARPLRRAGRWPLARSSALDSAEVRRLLPAREGPQSRLSREVCRGVRRAYDRTNSISPAAASTCATRRRGGAFVDALFETDWVVYAKPAFGGASAVLRYLGRYTHRVAISNHRLLAFDGERVTFSYKDYAHGDQRRTMTLTAMEFLRRFVQHILPRGFVRIRQSGFLANTCRVARVALARTVLATPSPAADHRRDRADDHRRRRPARRGRVRGAAPR